jgi:hypothetical protein
MDEDRIGGALAEDRPTQSAFRYKEAMDVLERMTASAGG